MAEVALGTKLEYKDGSGNWTELADIDGDSLEVPEITFAIAEFKPLKASHTFTRRLPGGGDAAPLRFHIVWTLAIQTTLYAFGGQTDIQWRITHPDGTSTETWAGHLAKLGRTFKRDQYTLMPIEIAIDGAPTLST